MGSEGGGRGVVGDILRRGGCGWVIGRGGVFRVWRGGKVGEGAFAEDGLGLSGWGWCYKGGRDGGVVFFVGGGFFVVVGVGVFFGVRWVGWSCGG